MLVNRFKLTKNFCIFNNNKNYIEFDNEGGSAFFIKFNVSKRFGDSFIDSNVFNKNRKTSKGTAKI